MKKFGIISFLLLAASVFAIPAYANTTPLSAHTIPQGTYETYFPSSNSNGFYIANGTTVSFSMTFATNESNVNGGYVRNGTYTTNIYSNGTKTMSGSFSVPATDYYKMFCFNGSAGTLSVTGGAITF